MIQKSTFWMCLLIQKLHMVPAEDVVFIRMNSEHFFTLHHMDTIWTPVCGGKKVIWQLFYTVLARNRIQCAI